MKRYYHPIDISLATKISLALMLIFFIGQYDRNPFPNVKAEAAQKKALPQATSTPSDSDWTILVEKAQKEGRVVIYGSDTGDLRYQLTKIFKDKYGIGLEFLAGRGSEIMRKLETERRAGLYLADVAVGGLTTFFHSVAPQKFALPLEPLLVLKEVNDPAKWRIGRIPFVGKNKEVISLASSESVDIYINEKMVKASEITSYNDLLSPKWKGKIIINDPTKSGSGNSWFSYLVLKIYGREKGIEYMKKLMLTEPAVIRDERLQVEWLAKGKYAVAVAPKGTFVESFIAAGAPIKEIILREGGEVSSGSTNVWAYSRPPHPNAAKLFLNWILTKEAGEIIQKTTGKFSERSDVSREGLDLATLPKPGAFQDEEYLVAKSEMEKVAAGIFADILK